EGCPTWMPWYRASALSLAARFVSSLCVRQGRNVSTPASHPQFSNAMTFPSRSFRKVTRLYVLVWRCVPGVGPATLHAFSEERAAKNEEFNSKVRTSDYAGER